MKCFIAKHDKSGASFCLLSEKDEENVKTETFININDSICTCMYIY